MTKPSEAAGAVELHVSQIAIAELGDAVLRAAWPEDIRDARQLALKHSIQMVHSTALNSKEQDVVDFAAPHWQWRLFGMPKDPLPDNLHYVQRGQWDPQVEPFTSYSGIRARQYAGKLAATHLAPFVLERVGNLQQHWSEISAKAEPVVAAMPIYQLLRSFVPDKAGGAQPLTYAERLSREQEIYNFKIYQAAVNGVHIDRKDLETRPGYDLVRRPMAALDYEESIHQRKDSQGDPWEKVRQLTLRQLTESYNRAGLRQYSVTWDRNNFYIKMVTQDGTEYNTDTSIKGTAYEVIERLHRGVPKNALFTPEDECKALLAMAFTSPPAEEYEHALATAMATSRERVVKEVIDEDLGLAGWMTGINKTGSFIRDQIHAYLSQSAGPVISFYAIEAWADEHGKEWRTLSDPPNREGTYFFSEYELEHARQTELGKVRGTLDRDRLVCMGRPMPGDIASRPVMDHDVELVFPAAQFGDNQPNMVGYNLVAAYRRGSAHYYQYEQAINDPLASKGEIVAPLSELAQLRVAEMCESIGLTNLAADIRYQQDCSVADLQRLLKRHSKYVYGNPAGQKEGAVAFGDLQQYVVNGKYHCQCTGASYLSGHLLRAIYADDPTIEVRTVSGLVAKRTTFSQGAVTAEAHSENHVYKNGVLAYVFDATPSVPFSSYSDIGRSLVEEDFAGQIEAIKPRQKEHANFVPSLHDLVQQEPLRAFDALYEKAHEILQLQYNAPDKAALYEKLVRLPRQDDDPTIRTLRLLRQGEANIQLSQVQGLLHYLRSMRTFSIAERRVIGFGRYTDGILDVLISTAVELYQLQASKYSGGNPPQDTDGDEPTIQTKS